MKTWEKNIRRVVPYVPGDQPKGDRLIKLNTNENPYPPAPKVSERLTDLDYWNLKKYPDPACTCLVDELAEYYGLDKNQVFTGVGSDDVLAMAFMTFFNSDKPVLFPDISYSFYQVWADLFRIPYKMPALDEKFRIQVKDYQGENGGVIFPNPNAPTGVLMPLSQVEDILKNNRDVIVIVDEAYIDFGGQSAMSLLPEYDNLLIVQTFSKSRSLAGLRIGYALGHPDLIQALNDVKYSFNSYTMNAPSLILGTEAVRDEAYFRDTLGKIISTRENAKVRLKELGFSFADSMANFIFASHSRVPAGQLFQALKQEQIYVRFFNQPRINNHLRITIGTDDEMEIMYGFLERYLKQLL